MFQVVLFNTTGEPKVLVFILFQFCFLFLEFFNEVDFYFSLSFFPFDFFFALSESDWKESNTWTCLKNFKVKIWTNLLADLPYSMTGNAWEAFCAQARWQFYCLCT